MSQSSMRWFAVPGYRAAGESPRVVTVDGELIATCETLDDAEQIVDDHNQSLERRSYCNSSIERTGTG